MTRARREKAEKRRSEHGARSVQHVTYHSINTLTKSTIADFVKPTILNLQPGDDSLLSHACRDEPLSELSKASSKASKASKACDSRD